MRMLSEQHANKEHEEHKGEGIMTFRNHGYRSVMTGATAPLLLGPEGQPIDWKDAMADTCESFNMPDLFEGNERKTKRHIFLSPADAVAMIEAALARLVGPELRALLELRGPRDSRSKAACSDE